MKTKPTNPTIRVGFTFTLQGAECSDAALDSGACSEWNYDNGRGNLSLREALWSRQKVPVRKRSKSCRGNPDRLLLAAR